MNISHLLIRKLTFISFFIFILSEAAHAAVIMDSSLSVSESYNDNIFFSKQNPKDDLTTVVSPAFSFAYTGKNMGLSLGYRGRALFYAENSDQNNFFHALSIDLDFPILNRQIRGVEVKIIEELSFSPELPGVSFIGGNDQKTIARLNRLPQGGGQGVQLRKTDTFQNQAGISLAYDWTERLNMTGQYTNIYTRFSGSQFEDRTANLSKFATSYRYPFSLKTTLTNSYGLAVTTGDRREQIIHSYLLELEHRMTPSLSATAGVGTAYIKGNSTPKPIFSASLNKLFQRGSLSVRYTHRISSGQGILQSVTRRQRVVGSANYSLGERTGVYLQGIYSTNKSVSASEINIASYAASTGISSQFLSWLSGSINYSYIKQDAKGTLNTIGKDGERNMISIELTATHLPWRIIK